MKTSLRQPIILSIMTWKFHTALVESWELTLSIIMQRLINKEDGPGTAGVRAAVAQPMLELLYRLRHERVQRIRLQLWIWINFIKRFCYHKALETRQDNYWNELAFIFMPIRGFPKLLLLSLDSRQFQGYVPNRIRFVSIRNAWTIWRVRHSDSLYNIWKCCSNSWKWFQATAHLR